MMKVDERLSMIEEVIFSRIFNQLGVMFSIDKDKESSIKEEVRLLTVSICKFVAEQIRDECEVDRRDSWEDVILQVIKRLERLWKL